MAATDHSTSFEDAFHARGADTAAACVACGKCFEACPITDDAGLSGDDPHAVTAGIRDILQTGEGPETAETWARSCVLSGECIRACDYGINPRLMLSMARMALSEHRTDERERRSAGIGAFNALSQGVKVLARLQLDDAALRRLGQDPTAPEPEEAAAPDFVFYTGCNVLKTPHIALLCLDIMDRLGITYRALGGPTHCCGVMQYRSGDLAGANRMARGTIEKFKQTGAGGVLAWCPSCQVQLSEIGLPTYERATGSKPFEMTPFLLFLDARLDDLRRHLVHPVEQRVALHVYRGIEGVAEAARRLLAAVPGVEIVDLGLPEAGLMSNYLRPLPVLHKKRHLEALTAAEAAGVDALAAIYHADHRELCAHERDWPFRIVNILEVVAESMGIRHDDHFKRMKLKQDADAILSDCADLLDRHGIDAEAARSVIETALLGEQPLPLRGVG